MKKRLFLLPLIGAFTLAGCSFEDLMFWKKKEDSSKKTPSGEVVPGGDEEPTEEPTVSAEEEIEACRGEYDVTVKYILEKACFKKLTF